MLTAKIKVNLALRINDSDAAAITVESQGGHRDRTVSNPQRYLRLTAYSGRLT
jgi:hypothetical protein